MNVVGMLAGLFLAWGAGALLAWRLWPMRAKPVLVLVALAWPAGLSLTSSAYFLWMFVSGGRAGWYPAFELASLAALAALALRRRARTRWVLPRGRPTLLASTAWLALLAATGSFLFATVHFAEAVPLGYWDAWARINLKARFLYAGGPEWTWIFHGPDVAHPDYPLLLEGSVARLWRWSGGMDSLPARVLSVLTWVGCLTALLAVVALLRSGVTAALAGLAFLCSKQASWWAAMQYSDFALATFFVWSAGVLVLAARRPARAERYWPLLGFSAASAAWCKNEGLAFAALVLALASARSIGAARLRLLLPALGRGLLLGGSALLVLKLGFSGDSSVFGPRTRSVLADLGDPARYRPVREFLAFYLGSEFMGRALAWLVLALLLLPGRRGPRRSWLPLVACTALATVFLVVMVTTREDQAWHVSTALDRLILQLWPLAILGVVAGLRARH